MPLDDFESRNELLRRLQETNHARKRGALPKRMEALERQVAHLSALLSACYARLEILELHLSESPAQMRRDLAQLTPREREILVAFARDGKVSAVARRLQRNYHTVRNQLLTARQRLGLKSRQALVRWIEKRQESGSFLDEGSA